MNRRKLAWTFVLGIPAIGIAILAFINWQLTAVIFGIGFSTGAFAWGAVELTG